MMISLLVLAIAVLALGVGTAWQAVLLDSAVKRLTALEGRLSEVESFTARIKIPEHAARVAAGTGARYADVAYSLERSIGQWRMEKPGRFPREKSHDESTRTPDAAH